MATTPEYIEYVASLVADRGAVRYKKTLGEYMVYVNDKPRFPFDFPRNRYILNK
jgi:TfoX/Sxy family transcriptional regulator of competence genes